MLALRTQGVLRFSELRTTIEGVSEKMLAQTLRELERDGLVQRTSRPVVPPYVDYRLTPMGEGVAERVENLVRYVEVNLRDFLDAQEAYDGASCAL
jgi:DNA-binding HxlR family transcriptional regulator